MVCNNGCCEAHQIQRFEHQGILITDTLSLDLEYCYGIGKFEAELEFKHKGYAIYAPNGVMKTSFAKTMHDLSEGKSPSDLAFPDRDSKFEVQLNGNPIAQDEIFVVRSYDENFSSEEVSTLLANADLKKKYEQVHKEIGEAKKGLDKKLRALAGFGERSREKIDPFIESIFEGSYYDVLLGLQDKLDAVSDAQFGEVDYKTLFDPKVLQLVNDPNVGATVDDFAKKYDELTESSPILRRDFQYHNVNQVQQQLEANNFFEAGHSISLVDETGDERTEHTSSQTLKEQIEAEKLRVLDDEDLRKKFDAFNSKIKNKELQAFRDYITENQGLLPELQDMEAFKRKVWLHYLHSARDEYDEVVSKYRNGQVELADIVAEAGAHPNDWDVVIKDFNRRFLHLPFQLTVENKSDVILKDTAPSIAFQFRDSLDERVYGALQRQDLLRVLSTGEARALYILNIMFEIHTRWKSRKKTLFVFDDVADSFDYKNKFAIIDYLEDVVKVEGVEFLSIILTHNFDFLRTIESRMICPAHQCRLAFKNGNEITLNDFKQSDIRSPFQKWQGRLSEDVVRVAYIPFLRNVVEYTQGKTDSDGNDNGTYLTLTRMLHYKDETEALTNADYKAAFEQVFPNSAFPNVDSNVKILDHLFATADQCLNADDGINLEHKIVLSIASRIWSERYIIGKIRGHEADYDSSTKQTGQLVQDFKNRFNNLTEEIGLLKRVSLITPANIHINAFMYEPILDMGFQELKALFEEVKGNLV